MMDKFVNKINNDNETDATLYIMNNRKKACPNEEEGGGGHIQWRYIQHSNQTVTKIYIYSCYEQQRCLRKFKWKYF